MLEWLRSSSHTAQQGFIHCWIKPCRTWEQHLGRHSLLSCLNTDVTFLCLKWWRRRRMSFVRTSGEVRISAQLQVYPKSSDGKQLHQFFLKHCPLNFEPTPYPPPPLFFYSSACGRSQHAAPVWLHSGEQPAGSTCRGIAGEQHSITGPRDTDVIRDTREVVGVGGWAEGPMAEVLAWWGSNGVG